LARAGTISIDRFQVALTLAWFARMRQPAPSKMKALEIYFASALLVACGQTSPLDTGSADANPAAAEASVTDVMDGAAPDANASSDDATVPRDATTTDSDPSGTDTGVLDADPPIADASEGGTSLDAADAWTGAVARIRVAHFATDDAALDFCVGPEGGPMQGPIFSPFMTFGDVSSYVTVPAGARYVVRIVPPNGPCTLPNPYVNYPDLTTGLLASGDAVTVTATGDTNTNESHLLRAFQDDVPADVPSGSVLLRVIDLASALAPADFGAGGGAAYLPLLTNVGLAQIPTASNVVGGTPIDARFVSVVSDKRLE
jgi:hypothetical protein